MASSFSYTHGINFLTWQAPSAFSALWPCTHMGLISYIESNQLLLFSSTIHSMVDTWDIYKPIRHPANTGTTKIGSLLSIGNRCIPHLTNPDSLKSFYPKNKPKQSHTCLSWTFNQASNSPIPTHPNTYTYTCGTIQCIQIYTCKTHAHIHLNQHISHFHIESRDHAISSHVNQDILPLLLLHVHDVRVMLSRNSFCQYIPLFMSFVIQSSFHSNNPCKT